MLKIANMEFKSRLIVGSGKYKDLEATRDATLASGAEIITVAVRRVNMMDKDSPNIMDYFEGTGIQFLPNSAGCKTAREAVNLFNMVREGIGIDFVKLEVIGDTEKTLYPDMVETLEAAKMLARDGFKVLCYTNDDPVMAKKLEDAGVSAIMPLASPIGSGLGIQNRYNVLFVKEAVSVPVIVDAGVGCASDATIAMELGADGVLTNSAIALAQDPVKMATAMRMAVEAGRVSYEAGRMEKKLFATPSSPTDHMPNL